MSWVVLLAVCGCHGMSVFCLSVLFLLGVQVQQGPKVIGMKLNRKGTLLLVNCQDKVIRLFEVEGGRREGAEPVEMSSLTAQDFMAAQVGEWTGSWAWAWEGPALHKASGCECECESGRGWVTHR